MLRMCVCVCVGKLLCFFVFLLGANLQVWSICIYIYIYVCIQFECFKNDIGADILLFNCADGVSG